MGLLEDAGECQIPPGGLECPELQTKSVAGEEGAGPKPNRMNFTQGVRSSCCSK